MAGAITSHHPAAFDKRFHTPPGLRIDADERRYAVFLCGGDCTEAPGGVNMGGQGACEKGCTAVSVLIRISLLWLGLIGWYT